jgi:peptidoglycan/xylan/chitin deacetylase (PgdA/CDA1 family)
MNGKHNLLCISIALLLLASCNNTPTTPTSSNTVNATTQPVNPYKVVDTTKQQIYLTFDDGPTTGSLRLYQYLLANKIPVTLYLVGKHYDAMPGLRPLLDSLRKQPYIVLANHTYSHAYGDKYVKFYTDVTGAINDFNQAQKVLNITSGIARCAGRNLWRTSLMNITDSVNGPGTALDSLYRTGQYIITGWDRTWPYDYKTFKNTKNAQEMLRITNVYFDSSYVKQPNSLVILGHDQQYADDEDFKQLTDYIDSIKANKRYQFATMDMYPGVRKN